jgi:hypothetical protein
MEKKRKKIEGWAVLRLQLVGDDHRWACWL